MSDQSSAHPRCAHRHADGEHCGRWPSPGSRFCYLHRQSNGDPALPGHPLARLSTPADLFDVIREALNAVRLGRIQPGQACALGYLAHLWLRVYRQLSCEDRESALQGHLLTEIAGHDADSLASAAATSVQQLPPLPDSPVAEALDEKSAQPAPSAFSLFSAEPRPNKKAFEKRILARLISELVPSPPSNGDAK